MTHSIRTRLFIAFISLSVFPLLLTGAIIGLQTFNTQSQQALTLQREIAARETEKVSGFFGNLERILTEVTRQGTLVNLSSRDQQITLSAILKQDVAFDKIFLLNSQGQEVAGISRTVAIANVDLVSRSDTQEFIVPTTDKTIFYSPIKTDEFTGEPIITIGLPIENLRTGLIDGVLVANLRLLGAQDLVIETIDEFQENTSIYLVDSKNQIVAHNDPTITLRGLSFAPPSEDAIQKGLNNKTSVLATDHFHLGTERFTIVVETPTSQALAFAYNTVSFTGVLILIALVASIVVTLLIVRQIVKPISSLAATAQAIERGDFSQRSVINRQDEIGQFASAFNAMTDAIQKRETDLLDQADALRIATAKAKEAARVKGEFLANVSHELRTPLNAIIGFSDMLLAGMSGTLNEKQTHKMGRLKDNGVRLLTLINDLLDLTRIESGRLETIEKAFSPQLLTERITSQMESLAIESGLKFETIISPDVPHTVFGDEKRVEQVMVNLLSNAFKFTKEGAVTLSINANQAENTWSLEVKDTGIGIPPHAVNVIFEEFRQLDGSYSRAYKGSGLGLAITRNLVRMMNGKINVKSVQGSGSTFTVILPIGTPETAYSEPLILEAVPS